MAGEYPALPTRWRRKAPRRHRGLRRAPLRRPHRIARTRLLPPPAARALDGPGSPVAHERWAIRDVDVPHSPDTRRILDRIDALIAIGAMPYDALLGWRRRTGTIIGCWLVRHGATGEEALSTGGAPLVHRGQTAPLPAQPRTDAQRRYVLGWSRAKTGSDPPI